MTMHPATAIDSVHLTISDLDRSVRFYETQLGLTTHRRDDRTAWLGAGRDDLLVLTADERAPRVRGTTGLYHFAVLVPSRVELARSLRRLVETDTVMQGFADHGVSEALYLADPDGNGIEIYRDRPRADWPFAGGRLRMGTDPLDIDDLLREVQGAPNSWAGLAEGTTIGHVHLHVSRLPEAERFYVDVLGFEVMQRYARAALFIAAGGYHHHVGLNTWAGVGAPPPPAGAIGLRHFVVRLPEEGALREVEQRLRAARVAVDAANTHLWVRDPAQNLILLTIRP
jgi:catechol 2,3-dioxygenase